MSVAFNKYSCFCSDLPHKVHNLETDDIRVYLTNSATSAGQTTYNTPADLGKIGRAHV
jgi:hypothetical protein